jgi:hypothetical protein
MSRATSGAEVLGDQGQVARLLGQDSGHVTRQLRASFARDSEEIGVPGARPRTLDEYVAEHAFQRLEQRLGACTTQPRDLAEYDRLPVSSSASVPDRDHGEDA